MTNCGHGCDITTNWGYGCHNMTNCGYGCDITTNWGYGCHIYMDIDVI